MKKQHVVIFSLMLAMSFSSLVSAKNDKEKSLPPGLQKQVEQGKGLPPGWRKKLIVGDILDLDIYRHGKVIATGNDGSVTIHIEDKVIKVLKNTREIIDILEGN